MNASADQKEIYARVVRSCRDGQHDIDVHVPALVQRRVTV